MGMAARVLRERRIGYGFVIMGIPRWAEKIAHDEPGKRFLRAYRRRRVEERGRPWVKAAVSAAGVLLLLFGLVSMLLPVLPGFLFAIPGVAILLGSTRKGARFLDWAELRVRAVCERWRFRGKGRSG